MLRRAARLIAQGQSLDSLRAATEKALAFLAADAGLARNRAWLAYFAGVLKAVEEPSQHACAQRGRSALYGLSVDVHQSALVE